MGGRSEAGLGPEGVWSGVVPAGVVEFRATMAVVYLLYSAGWTLPALLLGLCSDVLLHGSKAASTEHRLRQIDASAPKRDEGMSGTCFFKDRPSLSYQQQDVSTRRGRETTYVCGTILPSVQ